MVGHTTHSNIGVDSSSSFVAYAHRYAGCVLSLLDWYHRFRNGPRQRLAIFVAKPQRQIIDDLSPTKVPRLEEYTSGLSWAMARSILYDRDLALAVVPHVLSRTV